MHKLSITTSFALALAATLTISIPGAFADQEDGDRLRGEARTGTKILSRMTVETVFNTAPVVLGPALASANATAMASDRLEDSSDPVSEVSQDKSITFVLDDTLVNARQIFREHPGFMTDQIVEDLHSLRAVKEFLASQPGSYALVNLVAHGSPQTGLDIPVYAGGPKASLAALKRELTNPASYSADGSAQLRVYGCGLGRDPELLKAIGQYLNMPRVSALAEFIEFSAQDDLEVALRESLTTIARSRLKARDRIAAIANNEGIALPFRWENEMHTKPLNLSWTVSDSDADVQSVIRQSAAVQGELARLNTDSSSFAWTMQDGVLQAAGVVAAVSVAPGDYKTVLASADEATWLSAGVAQ